MRVSIFAGRFHFSSLVAIGDWLLAIGGAAEERGGRMGGASGVFLCALTHLLRFWANEPKGWGSRESVWARKASGAE
jgi:hypothetical protein